MDLKKTLLLIVGCGLFFSCSAYYQVDELYDKGNTLKAYQVLEKIQGKKNEHYQKRLYRVVSRLALDGDPDFIEKLRHLTEVKGHPAAASYENFARIYLDFLSARSPSQYAVIAQSLSNLEAAPPEFQPEACKIRGISYYNSGGSSNYLLAIDDFQKGFRLSAQIDSVLFIGKAYLGLSDENDDKKEAESYEKQAQNYFNRVLTSTADHFMKSMANYYLGEIELNHNRYPAALQKYQEALALYSNSPDTVYRIGFCLKKMKYKRLSDRMFKTALRIQKDYASAWFYLNINN